MTEQLRYSVKHTDVQGGGGRRATPVEGAGVRGRRRQQRPVRERGIMGKGGEEVAASRREDFLYSEQVRVCHMAIQTLACMHSGGWWRRQGAVPPPAPCVDDPRRTDKRAHGPDDAARASSCRRSHMPHARRRFSRSTPRSRRSCGPSPSPSGWCLPQSRSRSMRCYLASASAVAVLWSQPGRR